MHQLPSPSHGHCPLRTGRIGAGAYHGVGRSAVLVVVGPAVRRGHCRHPVTRPAGHGQSARAHRRTLHRVRVLPLRRNAVGSGAEKNISF